MAPNGGFLELKQRVTYSLLRAAARVGLRSRLSLKQMVSLMQMAYFREAREEQGHTLDAIAEVFGKSLRTVSTLHHQYRSDFFAPEKQVAFRRAIAALVNHAPADLDRLRLAFPDVSEAELIYALEDLQREGTLVARGTPPTWHRSPDAHEFTGADLQARIDGLNRQMDVLAETIWHRLVVQDDAPALARTYVFHASDHDFRAMLDAIETLVRERAIAADRAYDLGEDGRQVGITLAATPFEEAP